MGFKVSELAAHLDGETRGDPDLCLTGVAAIADAGPTDLTFVEARRQLPAALASRAGCLLVRTTDAIGDRTGILVAEPRLAFARAIARFHPPAIPRPGVSPAAVIDPGARLGAEVHIGPGAVIGDGATIGDRTAIGAGCVVGERVQIGADGFFHPRVVIYPGTQIGARVLVHAGAVLGADGFGFVRGPNGLVKFPQIGRLRIEDDVEIGANTTVDRGALGETVIGKGSKIDNLVQLAHNVRIGADCAISAQSGIAGSSSLGDGVTLGGQVGIGDHVEVRTGAVIGAQAGVASGKVVRQGQVMWGTPARPLDEVKRQLGHIGQLHRMRAELRTLGQQIERILARQPADVD